MSNDNKEKTFAVSEIFTSPQGEGVWSGTMMTFIRLAGCTVGKRYSAERYKSREEQTFVGLEEMPPEFPIYTEECTLYDGRKFACDTDYRKKESLTVEAIVARVSEGVEHVCISGGEPMMHDLVPLIRALWGVMRPHGTTVHIETSGTINAAKALGLYCERRNGVWITVSPKFGCLPEMIERADEIKLLVDKNFDPEKLPTGVLGHDTVYLQPVNGEHTVNVENLKLCMKWQREFPQWRVSLQLHKVLEHFVEERVR